VSNEEKDPSRPPDETLDPSGVVKGGRLGWGAAPGLPASVMGSAADDSPNEMVNEDGSWKSHAVEEKSDPASQPRGGLLRGLRRWFGR